MNKQLFAVYSKKAYFYTQFQWIFLQDSYTTNDTQLSANKNNQAYTQTQILQES